MGNWSGPVSRMGTATAAAADTVRLHFRGLLAEVCEDDTPWLDVEGALNCGKTTCCLARELDATQRWPGIWSYIGRFADGDNDSKLIPAWVALLRLADLQVSWDPLERCYVFDNGSRVYTFGLQSPDQLRRYATLRGLGVSRIYIDQAEELPADFFPELVQRMRQAGYPHQITLSPNPMGDDSWLADRFPEDNRLPGRRYYAVSLYDNAHNLPPDAVQAALELYPPGHAKHRSVILGRRGLNVTGKPVYAGAFQRAVHVQRCVVNPALALEQGIDFGKHHPCILFRQRTMYGGVRYLGGVMGQNMYLEDFLPIALQLRDAWFPDLPEVLTACDPAGSHDNSQGVKVNGVGVLRGYGLVPQWKPDSNRPSVRFALMEHQAGLMRKRTPEGEAFLVEADPDRWLRVTGDGLPPARWAFFADGLEAGYVWDPLLVSEGSKQYRRAHKDGWYEHGQNAAEYLEVNFPTGAHVTPKAAPTPLPVVTPVSVWG